MKIFSDGIGEDVKLKKKKKKRIRRRGNGVAQMGGSNKL